MHIVWLLLGCSLCPWRPHTSFRNFLKFVGHTTNSQPQSFEGIPINIMKA